MRKSITCTYISTELNELTGFKIRIVNFVVNYINRFKYNTNCQIEFLIIVMKQLRSSETGLTKSRRHTLAHDQKFVASPLFMITCGITRCTWSMFLAHCLAVKVLQKERMSETSSSWFSVLKQTVRTSSYQPTHSRWGLSQEKRLVSSSLS